MAKLGADQKKAKLIELTNAREKELRESLSLLQDVDDEEIHRRKRSNQVAPLQWNSSNENLLRSQLADVASLDDLDLSLNGSKAATCVVVPTRNAQKVSVVNGVCADFGQFEVLPIRVNSGDGKQPRSLNQGIEEACKRIKGAIHEINKRPTLGTEESIGRVLISSFESFVHKHGPDEYVDYCVMILYDATSGDYCAGITGGCRFPAEFVKISEEMEAAGIDTTAGEVMKFVDSRISNSDPHMTLCGIARGVFLTITFMKIVPKMLATCNLVAGTCPRENLEA